MNPVRVNCLRVALLAALWLTGGCEPDDPKVQKEVAELRARIAELERQKQATLARPDPAPAKPMNEGIPRETLRRNLESQMPALRAALIKAFPDYQVDPVNAATISTPQDSGYLPYSTELSFGLSKGQTVASFSIRIGADRSGNWQLPDFEDLAASVGNLASSGASPGTSRETGSSSRGATMSDNVRQIRWDDNGGSTTVDPRSQPPPEPREEPRPSRQPSGNAPFPVQDSRTIQFE